MRDYGPWEKKLRLSEENEVGGGGSRVIGIKEGTCCDILTAI